MENNSLKSRSNWQPILLMCLTAKFVFSFEILLENSKHVVQLSKEDISSIELIKVFLETERKLYVDIEMVMHVICVAAAKACS